MKRPEDYFNYPDIGENRGPVFISEIVAGYLEFLKDRQIWLSNPAEFRLQGNQHWYREIYLNSIYWVRYVRPFMLGRADHKCESCGRRDDVVLDVHHKTYDRLGFELPEDLEVLCRDCHEAEHGVIVENTAPIARPHIPQGDPQGLWGFDGRRNVN